MHLFISVGEPSGDQHAAQVVHELRKHHPDLKVSGFGGIELQEAGQHQLYRLTDLAVMGIMAVLPLIRKFWGLYKQADAFLKAEKPDAVLLVDFPGFNWWIAKAAQRAGIPVYYYCPPQIWAWAGWRIRKVRRYVDCVLSVLPFEAKWYRDKGIDVEYVGHPFFDEVAKHPLNQNTIQEIKDRADVNLAILPGSRKLEVNQNFQLMLDIASEIHRRHPKVRFPVACYKPWHLERCQQLIDQHGEQLPIDLYLGKTSEILATADCSLMVSGSVSLELLARHQPAVVVYRGGIVMAALAHLLVQCKYMTLPNLIAEREIMPEFPCIRRTGSHVTSMVQILDSWLSSPSHLEEVRSELRTLAESVVQQGGVACCAETLLRRMNLPLTERVTTKEPNAA